MDSLLKKTRVSPEPIIKDQVTPLARAKSPEAVAVSESGDRRLSKLGRRQVDQPEKLRCPRCDSTNTKFCYYNNYNLSQPRHLCKSCRRYWTRGGALRNVPVGGATRKPSSSNKRPRTSSSSNNFSVACTSHNDRVTGHTQALEPVVSDRVQGLDVAKLGISTSTTSCWWSATATTAHMVGLLPFSGYGNGIGLGPALGYEPGLLDWAMEPVTVSGGAVVDPGCSTWHSDQGGEAEAADYISWPEVAVSTPAKALKSTTSE